MALSTRFILNGKEVEVEAHPGSTLLDVLKHGLGVNSVKRGCETGECGACTVLLDGSPVNSCLVLAARMTGRKVVTLEGLSDSTIVQQLQHQFIEHNALQCGFCTPGMLITLYALLEGNPTPTDDEIKTAIEGNLCRCGAYLEIENATRAASSKAGNSTHT